MKTKEKFLDEMSNLWDKLHYIEQSSSDFYEFEKRFEHEMNTLEHHTLQDILGSEHRDRRVKKKVQTRYGTVEMSTGHRYIQYLHEPQASHELKDKPTLKSAPSKFNC
jgi:hypothetical protein